MSTYNNPPKDLQLNSIHSETLISNQIVGNNTHTRDMHANRAFLDESTIDQATINYATIENCDLKDTIIINGTVDSLRIDNMLIEPTNSNIMVTWDDPSTPKNVKIQVPVDEIVLYKSETNPHKNSGIYKEENNEILIKDFSGVKIEPDTESENKSDSSPVSLHISNIQGYNSENNKRTIMSLVVDNVNEVNYVYNMNNDAPFNTIPLSINSSSTNFTNDTIQLAIDTNIDDDKVNITSQAIDTTLKPLDINGSEINITADEIKINGNLTVTGDTTTISQSNIEIEDVIFYLAQNNGDVPDVLDQGICGEYKSGPDTLFWAIFRDASDGGKIKLRYNIQNKPTTTVDNTGAYATLQIGELLIGANTINETKAGLVSTMQDVSTTSTPTFTSVTIGANTINETKAGLVSTMQDVSTTSTPTFSSVTIGANTINETKAGLVSTMQDVSTSASPTFVNLTSGVYVSDPCTTDTGTFPRTFNGGYWYRIGNIVSILTNYTIIWGGSRQGAFSLPVSTSTNLTKGRTIMFCQHSASVNNVGLQWVSGSTSSVSIILSANISTGTSEPFSLMINYNVD